MRGRTHFTPSIRYQRRRARCGRYQRERRKWKESSVHLKVEICLKIIIKFSWRSFEVIIDKFNSILWAWSGWGKEVLMIISIEDHFKRLSQIVIWNRFNIILLIIIFSNNNNNNQFINNRVGVIDIIN